MRVPTRGTEEKTFAERLGRVLALRRVQNGYSQEDIAYHLGLTQTQISRFEMGRQWPGLKHLVALADFYSEPLAAIIDDAEHWGE